MSLRKKCKGLLKIINKFKSHNVYVRVFSCAMMQRFKHRRFMKFSNALKRYINTSFEMILWFNPLKNLFF